MKNDIKLLKVIAYSCFLLFALILAINFLDFDASITRSQVTNSFIAALVIFVIGLFCILIRQSLILKDLAETQKYNALSFEEKCKVMAGELSFGKRKWYLQDHDDGYLALPLHKDNMKEFGEGRYVSAGPEIVNRLLEQKKILNEKTAKTVLHYWKPSVFDK